VFCLPASSRLNCSNTEYGVTNVYSNTDCSGTPSSYNPSPVLFGCVTEIPFDDDVAEFSFYTLCMSGDFDEAPSPAMNTFYYDEGVGGVCPQSNETFNDNLYSVGSYLCGTCFDTAGSDGETVHASYNCDSSNNTWTMSYYSDNLCTGDAIATYDMPSLDCDPAAQQDEYTSVSYCNSGTTETISKSTHEHHSKFKGVPAATQFATLKMTANKKAYAATPSP